MMRVLGKGRVRQLTVAIGLVVMNALVVVQLTGVAYQPFSWQAFASHGPIRQLTVDNPAVKGQLISCRFAA
jgi:hypothetical protein